MKNIAKTKLFNDFMKRRNMREFFWILKFFNNSYCICSKPIVLLMLTWNWDDLRRNCSPFDASFVNMLQSIQSVVLFNAK
jgi:hypothetical protein